MRLTKSRVNLKADKYRSEGDNYHLNGDYAAADVAYAHALKHRPGYAPIHMHRAQNYLAMKKCV